MSEIVTDQLQSVTDRISLRPIVTGRSQIPAHNIVSAFGEDFEFGLQDSRDFSTSLAARSCFHSFVHPKPLNPILSHLTPPLIWLNSSPNLGRRCSI